MAGSENVPLTIARRMRSETASSVMLMVELTS